MVGKVEKVKRRGEGGAWSVTSAMDGVTVAMGGNSCVVGSVSISCGWWLKFVAVESRNCLQGLLMFTSERNFFAWRPTVSLNVTFVKAANVENEFVTLIGGLNVSDFWQWFLSSTAMSWDASSWRGIDILDHRRIHSYYLNIWLISWLHERKSRDIVDNDDSGQWTIWLILER